MADFASDAINIAQNTNQQAAHTGQDALNAYHIAATAEHARQELDMEKQKQDQAKSDWFNSQLSAIAKMPPETQKLAQKSFTDQAQKLFPGMNPDVATAMSKDGEFVRNLSRTFSSQHNEGLAVADAVGTDLPTLQTHMEHVQQQDALVRAGQVKSMGQMSRSETYQSKFEQDTHNKYMEQAFGDNKQPGKLLATYQNLYNAVNNFKNGGASPQEFNELQQAVRSNAGIKGAGGVGEREETYLKSLGIDAAKVNQFLTGDPQSVIKSDPKFAAQIIQLANMEMDNKKRQASQLIDATQKGGQTFYKTHPELAQDYADRKNAFVGQFDAHKEQQAPAGPPPGSIIKLKDGSRHKVEADGTLSEVK